VPQAIQERLEPARPSPCLPNPTRFPPWPALKKLTCPLSDIQTRA
jgi:hypothetical protein